MKLNKFEPNREIQRLLKKTLFNTQIDYEIFSFGNLSLGSRKNSNGINVGGQRIGLEEFYKYFRSFAKGEINIDDDNSNTYFVPGEDITVIKNKTPRGFFYNFYISFSGKAINIFTIEEFSGNNKFTNDVGRFIFRGAFYYFGNFIPGYIFDLYFQIKQGWENNRLKNGSFIKRTRVDVAFDFECPVFNYAKYTNVSSVSKTAVKAYNPNDEGLYRSFSYLPTKSNKGYGFRIYDKIKDTKDKNKDFWYGDLLKDLKSWQRIEYEVYPPYSHQCTDEELFAGFSSVLLGTEKIDKKIIWAPKTQYNKENLLKNFDKYSKNHGVNTGVAILDLTDAYFNSPDIPLFDKLDTFANSIKNAQDNNIFSNILLSNNLTDDQLMLLDEYLKTPNGQIIQNFVSGILSKTEEKIKNKNRE